MFLLKTKNYQKFSIDSVNSGFTLIEALTVLFIFAMITTTFYSVFSLGTRYIIESKNRLGAVSLANEKMEIIRNLEYDAVGISGGIPSGNIVAEEDVLENKHNYHVKTFVQYVDDPFDGVLPIDVIPTDYKSVKVTVSWDGASDAKSKVELMARFVPPGIEQNTSGGTLSINIIGSDGIGVPQSEVHITNSTILPTVNMSVLTDNSGNIILPGAKQSIQQYYISVAKDGYEAVTTINPDSVAYSVIDVPASVVDGMLNTKSIIQDKLIDLKIIAVDYLGVPLPNISFSIEGGRILGSDMLYSPAKPTYNLIADKITDTDGEVKFNDISPGQFFISNIVAVSGYTLIGMDNFSSIDLEDNKYAIVIPPGSSQEINMKFAKNDDNSLLAQVFTQADDSPIAGAEVTLSNTSGYNEKQTTLIDGVAFLPASDTQLTAGTYELKVTAEGFADYTANIDIDKLTTQQIKLTSI
jgi:prepilin-type N-terminal cleavage/methylation domain-containing protein